MMDLPPTLDSEAIYQALDLRSFRSSLSEELRTSCADTLADLFERDLVRTDGAILQVSAPGWFYRFTAIQPSTILFHEKALDESRDVQATLSVSYDAERGMWVASDPGEPDFRIEKPEHCPDA